MTRRLILGALLLALATPAGAAEPVRPRTVTLPDPTAEVPDPQAALFEDPPPVATKEEAALWQAGRAANLEVRTIRLEAKRVQTRAGFAETAKRLDEALAVASGPTADKLRDLRRHLSEEYLENFQLLNGRWPVDPTRVCRYPHQRFDAALKLPKGQARGVELALAWQKLDDCIQRARLAVGRMAESNRELTLAIDRAEAALAEVAAGRQSPSRPPGADEAREPAAHETHDRPAPGAAEAERRDR